MAKSKGEVKPYQAEENIHHDGEAYVPGESIDLSDADAEPLLKVKAISPMKPKVAAEPPKGKSEGKSTGKAADKPEDSKTPPANAMTTTDKDAPKA